MIPTVPTWKDVRDAAQAAIDADDDLVYDVAVDHGQIVDNVKHMTWFVDAVAKAFIETRTKFAHVRTPE